MRDAGRTVIGVDLLGHGTAPKPHDPAAYDDLTTRVVEALPDGPSTRSGSRWARSRCFGWRWREPQRFNRLVLAGHRRIVFATDDTEHRRIIAALEGHGDPDDNLARMFVQYAGQPGNDIAALTAVMKRAPCSRSSPRCWRR